MRQGFDNDKYIALQAEHIRNRIDQFGGKLYLEFGGKLFDDYHAARVLPGFEPDSKIRMLKQPGRRRGDHRRHQRERHREEQAARRFGHHLRRRRAAPHGHLPRHGLSGGQRGGDPLRGPARRPTRSAAAWTALGIKSYLHYPIPGYPYDIDHIVSDEGFGENEYVETSRPLVVVTAPGPGSRQDGHVPLAALPRAQARHSGRLRQVRDVPHLEPAAQAPGEHRLRGGHGRPGRREHHRPLPLGSLRRDHRELQPRRGDVPRAESHDGAHLRRPAPTSRPPTWA